MAAALSAWSLACLGVALTHPVVALQVFSTLEEADSAPKVSALHSAPKVSALQKKAGWWFLGGKQQRRQNDDEQIRAWTKKTRTSLPKPVRVFVYEGPGVGWIHECNLTRIQDKHYDLYPDVVLHRKLSQHPWRVRDPKKADVFFVPAYLTLSIRNACGNHEENMASTARMLEESKHFLRNNGSDHLISGFGWEMSPAKLGALGPYSELMVVAHFEKAPYFSSQLKKAHNSFPKMFAVPYGPVKVLKHQKGSWANVPYQQRRHTLFFMGQADGRPSYKERRVALRKLKKSFPDSVLVQTGGGGRTHRNPALRREEYYDEDDPWDLHAPLPACGTGELAQLAGCHGDRSVEQYVRLGQQSKYWLVIHGDTPSTSRLYDSVQLGAVPLVISADFDYYAMPYPDELPWRSFAVFVNQHAFNQDPAGEIQKAVDHASALELHKNMALARSALDWTTEGHCQGAMVLSHVARVFLHRRGLPPASELDMCQHADED